MTHLHIAYNILSNTPQIKKPCDFMLGAIAPDSVHFCIAATAENNMGDA